MAPGVQTPGWLLQSPGLPHPEASWFSDLPVPGVLGTLGTRHQGEGAGGHCGSPRAARDDAGEGWAAGGELVLLLDKNKEETGDFPR